MFRFFSTLLFILSVVSFSFAQSKSNDAIKAQMKSLNTGKNFELNYDKASNTSKLLAFGDEFDKGQARSSGLSSMSFGMTFNYQGTTLTATPETFIVTFWARGASKAKYADSHHLMIMVDGESIDLGDARYANKNEGTEYLNFYAFPRSALMKMASGKDVKMKIGNYEFTFKPGHIKMFANLLALSDLNTKS